MGRYFKLKIFNKITKALIVNIEKHYITTKYYLNSL